MTVTIGRNVLRFETPREVLAWCHSNGYRVDPTKRGIAIVDIATNETICTY